MKYINYILFLIPGSFIRTRLRKNKTKPANNIKKLKSIHDFRHFQTFKLVNHLRLCFCTYFHGFAIPSPTFSL